MRFCALLLMMSMSSCSKGQELLIEKVVPLENLSETIEELSEAQKACDYHDYTLMYLVRDISDSESLKLSITMIEGLEFIPEQMLGDIIGWFEISGKTVLLMGEKLKRVCVDFLGKKKFRYQSDLEIYPSDYSLWIYELEGNQLIKLNSFEIPCE